MPEGRGFLARFGDLMPELSIGLACSLVAFARAFDAAGIPYCAGGSVAARLHGIEIEPHDLDFALPPFPGKEAAFLDALPPGHDGDAAGMARANRRSRVYDMHDANGILAELWIDGGEVERGRTERAVTIEVLGYPVRVKDVPDLIDLLGEFAAYTSKYARLAESLSGLSPSMYRESGKVCRESPNILRIRP